MMADPACNTAAARSELAPDDAVGNILCDLLTERPASESAIRRVLNHYGGWAEAAPTWVDVRKTLDADRRLAALFPAGDHGLPIWLRSSDQVGVYQQCVGGTGWTTVDGHRLEQLVQIRGQPELVVESEADCEGWSA